MKIRSLFDALLHFINDTTIFYLTSFSCNMFAAYNILIRLIQDVKKASRVIINKWNCVNLSDKKLFFGFRVFTTSLMKNIHYRHVDGNIAKHSLQSMKIMVIARLFSGLNTLLESGHWEHAGSPAYYHFIRGLDAETSWDYTLCFLLPHPYTGFECKRSLNITNLRSSALIVPYYSLPFSSSFTLIKKAEYFYNKLSQYIAVLPSLIGSNCFYIDRENLLLGAFLLPFKKKIAVRLLGVTESVYLNVTQKRNIYSSLLRYVFTHRNSLFICTRDGSFSDQMGAWLSWKRFYIFFNGIDSFVYFF